MHYSNYYCHMRFFLFWVSATLKNSWKFIEVLNLGASIYLQEPSVHRWWRTWKIKKKLRALPRSNLLLNSPSPNNSEPAICVYLPLTHRPLPFSVRDCEVSGARRRGVARGSILSAEAGRWSWRCHCWRRGTRRRVCGGAPGPTWVCSLPRITASAAAWVALVLLLLVAAASTACSASSGPSRSLWQPEMTSTVGSSTPQLAVKTSVMWVSGGWHATVLLLPLLQAAAGPWTCTRRCTAASCTGPCCCTAQAACSPPSCRWWGPQGCWLGSLPRPPSPSIWASKKHKRWQINLSTTK